MSQLRQAVISVLGHVDHGKTKLLDKIRGSATAVGEAGGITQAIGASIIPLETIKKICGPLLSEKMKFSIPGLLIIDTPGHAAFTTLRKRGGSIADIAILVIDINQGIQPQTVESLEILKNFKTPFVIAANKVDLIPGYRQLDKNILKNISSQEQPALEKIETKLYEIVGKLSELGFNSERFDRVEDYTKQVAIIPVSAVTGEGIPELLMVMIGLAQKYLEANLELEVKGNAKGTVLEIKEATGLGKTLDVIIYDGILHKGDKIMIGGLEKPIVTKVKALLEPLPLKEMRDKKTQFRSVNEIVAATGVKVSAPDIDNVIAGMPLQSYSEENKAMIEAEIQKEVQEVMIKTEDSGIIIKADTLGSLEALTFLLREKSIPIRKAGIGKITKKDLTDAESSYERTPLLSVILGFNVERDADVQSSDRIKIITSDIIYTIIGDLEKWQAEQKRLMEAKELDSLTRPCKLQVMPNYVFRQSNPAIVGIDVLEGKVKTGTQLMKSGSPITTVRGIQHEKENMHSLEKGKQAAFSLDNVTVGRQINEGDILYSFIQEEDFRKIKKLAKYLTHGEVEILKETAEIMRKHNPLWGI